MAVYTRCLQVHCFLTRSFTTISKCSPRRLVLNNGQNKRKDVTVHPPANIHTGKTLFKRRKTAEEKKSTKRIEFSPKSKIEIIDVWRDITVSELAEILNREVSYVYDIFLNTIHGPNTIISDVKQLQEAIRRSGRRIHFISKPKNNHAVEEVIDVFPRPHPLRPVLKPRPPVITVMGHVDHGKTTLLDALRHSRVVDQEFGGITQHIGAFSVQLESGARITFLDTPGHAAFSAMRARGANVTDIVVLVVAADDGVMEQTVESIRMACSANVPIMVAINKIDAPNADVERTQQMLTQVGIQVEQMGGDVQSVPISALKKKNLDQLTEALILQAELLDIGADPTGPAEAVVIESQVDKHRGRLCTVVIKRGTLKRGSVLVAGTALAKVRTLRNSEGQRVEEVLPGYPAEIEGWKELPPAGEIVLQVESEKRARAVIKFRADKRHAEREKEDVAAISSKREQHQREYKEKLELKRRMGRFKLKPDGPRKPEIAPDGGNPRLNLVIKADVDGTLEALLDTLDTYESEECEMDLVHYGVGDVNETDVELAQSFGAIIYSFNVEYGDKIQRLAEESGVPVKVHNVIYKLVDDVKEEIDKRLPKKEAEEVLGEAAVLQLFHVNEKRKKVPVAGCRCVKGSLKRSASYRLLRNEEIVHEGTLMSLRHLKNEVDTIKKDVECGLQLTDKTVIFQPGDTFICYEKKMVPQTTSWNPGF